jgi:hypothetical protein
LRNLRQLGIERIILATGDRRDDGAHGCQRAVHRRRPV